MPGYSVRLGEALKALCNSRVVKWNGWICALAEAAEGLRHYVRINARFGFPADLGKIAILD